jgi:hypothetical protein
MSDPYQAIDIASGAVLLDSVTGPVRNCCCTEIIEWACRLCPGNTTIPLPTTVRLTPPASWPSMPAVYGLCTSCETSLTPPTATKTLTLATNTASSITWTDGGDSDVQVGKCGSGEGYFVGLTCDGANKPYVGGIIVKRTATSNCGTGTRPYEYLHYYAFSSFDATRLTQDQLDAMCAQEDVTLTYPVSGGTTQALRVCYYGTPVSQHTDANYLAGTVTIEFLY